MNVLLVEDDDDSRNSIADFICSLGHQVSLCDNGEDALNLFGGESFELVLTDIKMPKMTGIELLRHLNQFKSQREFDVILFTGHGDMETAIEALRAGARDYLLKPINIKDLASLIEQLEHSRYFQKKNASIAEKASAEIQVPHTMRGHGNCLHNVISAIPSIGDIGVFSEKFKTVFEQALLLHTDRNLPVLIQGETGTGKEIIARLIHYGCSNYDLPFVDLNCAALSPTLFESELFGYEAGAYTGGLTKGSKGKMDIASGGSLFLDEIGEMSIDLQAKMLRIIQEREYYRVGGLKKVRADIRLICATNLDLKERVRSGSFRQDLYYRLNVGFIVIPPLRERKDEIVPLTEMFLRDFTRQKGKDFRSITSEAADILIKYSWPGNVRELRNLVEWIVFRFDDTELRPEHLKNIHINACCSSSDEDKVSSVNLKSFVLPEESLPLESFFCEIIEKALEKHQFNKTRTADYLGITRRTLYSYLERMKRVRNGLSR